MDDTILISAPKPKFIDPVVTKASPKRSFSIIENQLFGLVLAKTGYIILGTFYRNNLRDWLPDSMLEVARLTVGMIGSDPVTGITYQSGY